jgi:proton-translocating NADH-quinone oxidoreductase chain M
MEKLIYDLFLKKFDFRELWLSVSVFIFVYVNYMWITFNPHYNLYNQEWWITLGSLDLQMGTDGISLFFIYLTATLIPLCLLFGWKSEHASVNAVALLSIEILLILAFQTLNLFIFYILFEAILIPFFIFIGLNGYRARRIHAAYLLLFYTLVGSFLMIVTIFTAYIHTGSMNLNVLMNTEWPETTEKILWMCLFLSLAIKIPIFPFHIWLPEAHVESPTEGSVLLAGVLLKLGTYGMIRFLFGLFPNATIYYTPLILILGTISILYTSLTTLRQIDIKRVIAYSSVAHMNMCVLGLAMYNTSGYNGSILLMIGHGFVSGALFFLVGMLYERFHTKLIKYYSGLIYFAPLCASFFFFFTISNMSMPGTSNFIGEFLILTSLVLENQYLLTLVAVFGIFIGSVYSIWLYNKTIFGLVNPDRLNYAYDLSWREINILSILVFFTLWIGCYPMDWINVIHQSSAFVQDLLVK